MVVLFGVAAAVQYNDPDPFLWMAVYVAGAALSVLIPRVPGVRRFVVWLAPLVLLWAASLAWSGLAAGGMDGVLAGRGMESPGVEELREAGGLLIVSAWWVCLWWGTSRDDAQGLASP